MDLLVNFIAAPLLAASVQMQPTVIYWDWTNADITASGAVTSFNINNRPELLLPPRTVVLDAYIYVRTAATGPTTVSMSLGRVSSGFIDYIVSSSIKATAGTTYGDAEAEMGTTLTAGKTDTPSVTGTTQLTVQVNSGGALLNTVANSTGRVALTVFTLPPIFAQDNFTLTSPKPFAFVRRGQLITVAGVNNGPACTIEAAIGAGAYSTVASNVSGAFSGTITAPATCLNDATVWVRCSTNTLASVAAGRVSVGVVAVILGQSGGSGMYTNNQTYTGKTRGFLYTNGHEWAVGIPDPTDMPYPGDHAVSRDTPGVSGARGSPWPIFASLFANDTGCPVAIVPTAMGGTAIDAHLPTANHNDTGTLYGSANVRAAVTGCDIAFWRQGEADALSSMPQTTYRDKLYTYANAFFADRGCKVIPAKMQNNSGIPDVDEARINAAIGEAWTGNNNIAAGPDFSAMPSGDFYHLTSDADAATEAAGWNTAARAALSL